MMNERIRELAGRALDQAVPETWSALTGEQLSRFQEKFAELIVRECTQIVADAVDHREPASTYVGKIREHFGVKQ
jgi:hypothetical protein